METGLLSRLCYRHFNEDFDLGWLHLVSLVIELVNQKMKVFYAKVGGSMGELSDVFSLVDIILKLWRKSGTHFSIFF